MLFHPALGPGQILYFLSAVPLLVRCVPNPHPNAQTPSLAIFPEDVHSSDAGNGLPTIPSLNASSAHARLEPLCDAGYFGHHLRKTSCYEAIHRLNDELSPMGQETGEVVYGTIHTLVKDVVVPRRISSRE